MLHGVIRGTLLIATFVAFTMSTGLARDDIRTENVRFEPGATSATVEGKIKGYEVVDYVLEAGKGQQMNVSMATDNLSSYFNILPPGESDVAIFVGSTSGNDFEGVLPRDGAYTVRVALMRSAARRAEVATYRLQLSISGAAQKSSQ